MHEKEKQIRLIGKLWKMTQAGDLDWSFIRPPRRLLDEGKIVSQTFESSAGGMTFKVFQVELLPKGSARIGDFFSGKNHLSSLFTILEYREEEAPLEQYDTIVSAGDIPLLTSLYEAARQSSTQIDKKIDAFLKSEDVHAERPS